MTSALIVYCSYVVHNKDGYKSGISKKKFTRRPEMTPKENR
jgi:hypothetical protein